MHCAYRLPKVLQLYRKRCPDVQLIFRPTPNEDLIQSLYDGRNDVISGIGIAFLPQLAVSGELERGELAILPWEMTELRVATQMAWHK